MGNSELLLIVDDNIDDYYILKRLIEGNYETVYDNGESNIIELIDRYNPECIILDYHLGLYDGLDILKIIKK